MSDQFPIRSALPSGGAKLPLVGQESRRVAHVCLQAMAPGETSTPQWLRVLLGSLAWPQNVLRWKEVLLPLGRAVIASEKAARQKNHKSYGLRKNRRAKRLVVSKCVWLLKKGNVWRTSCDEPPPQLKLFKGVCCQTALLAATLPCAAFTTPLADFGDSNVQDSNPTHLSGISFFVERSVSTRLADGKHNLCFGPTGLAEPYASTAKNMEPLD